MRVINIESTRQKIQAQLDSAKTHAERNRLGQFATPAALALDIVQYAKSLMAEDPKIRFLDPAFGTGSFYSALLQTFSPLQIVSANGYEIDAHIGHQADTLWHKTSLKLTITDFTQTSPPVSNEEKANLIVCNPPYVRHHHLPSSEKSRLHLLAKQISRVKLSGLVGLYCYFLCIAHGWMADNALAGWLIPSEFMDVNYGREIKRYLLNDVTVLHIHRFEPSNVQFEDALVSSAIVWLKKTLPPRNHVVEFTYGGTLAQPKFSKLITSDTLHETGKWTKLPLAFHIVENKEQPRLSNFFKIKRGLATGANEFFMLTLEQISQYGLPSKFLIPILPSPRYLFVDEVHADSNGNPILDPKLFLLACHLPEDKVKTQYPLLWKYLQSGIACGISNRYLCKHRQPWYSQEDRPATSFLCTYMGRQRKENEKPFRFILNHSNATAANAYLMLYPKPVLENILRKEPKWVNVIWKALQKISSKTLTGEGRVYGGGLYKMEPKELENTPADILLEVLPNLMDSCVSSTDNLSKQGGLF